MRETGWQSERVSIRFFWGSLISRISKPPILAPWWSIWADYAGKFEKTAWRSCVWLSGVYIAQVSAGFLADGVSDGE